MSKVNCDHVNYCGNCDRYFCSGCGCGCASPTVEKEVIKHAAVKSVGGMIFLGKSHRDCFHQAHYVDVVMSPKALDQGFFTSHGRYVDREEAAAIAVAAGQVDPQVKILFSEDLWLGGIHKYDSIKGYI